MLTRSSVKYSLIVLVGLLLVQAGCKKTEKAQTNTSQGKGKSTVVSKSTSKQATAKKVVETVPLKIKLPKPVFRGTPKNLRVDNLDKTLPKDRPVIMVPKGTKNVALHKEVTSSDDMPIIGDLEQVTDGDKAGMDGSYVELGPGKQWVQIDLGAMYKIYAIYVWHYHAEARVYNDVVVQIADDPDFIKNVRTVFNNDNDNSSGLGIGKDKPYMETNYGKQIAVNGQVARYVRLYSNGNTSNDENHYTEVEVYGIPVK